MMDAQTRLKLTLGDLLMQLSIAHSRIEELEAELAAEKAKSAAPGENRDKVSGNGGMKQIGDLGMGAKGSAS